MKDESYLEFTPDTYLGAVPLAMLAMASYGPSISERRNDGSIGALPKNPKKVIPKGCKEFIIDGVPIVALNAKNAFKKYLKHINK